MYVCWCLVSFSFNVSFVFLYLFFVALCFVLFSYLIFGSFGCVAEQGFLESRRLTIKENGSFVGDAKVAC